MTKEKTKPTDAKLTNESVSKNVEREIKKDNTPATTSADNTSINDKESKPSSPEVSSTEKKKYVRGESQKPVTNDYRNNWNTIFKK